MQAHVRTGGHSSAAVLSMRRPSQAGYASSALRMCASRTPPGVEAQAASLWVETHTHLRLELGPFLASRSPASGGGGHRSPLQRISSAAGERRGIAQRLVAVTPGSIDGGRGPWSPSIFPSCVMVDLCSLFRVFPGVGRLGRSRF